MLCEDGSVPYVYVPSKADLGSAASTKRPTSVVMVHTSGKNAKPLSSFEAADKLQECLEEIKELPKRA